MDGVYMLVHRDKKDTLSIEPLIEALKSVDVTNYDRERIEEVLNRARGVSERIGPLFDYYNSALEEYVTVRIDGDKAYMKIDSEFIIAGLSITPTNLLYCLNKKEIRFGYLEDAINLVITENQYDDEVCVAKSVKPVDGKDGTIYLEVDYNPDLRPQQRRDGSVDFRAVQSFTQISNGQVIAKKTPPTNGTPGKTVTGEIIPSTPGEEAILPQGKNTIISENGMSLIASKAGFIQSEGSLLCVFEELVIPKDIDYSIGNIKFSGNLEIRGNIKSGFTVEAEGDILIHGQVESATVKSREGAVTIKKGVLGKGKAKIYAKSTIDVLFAQEATLETEGSITVERHCLQCQTTCNTFEAVKPSSTLVGGLITATQRVTATHIGNDKGVDTKIVLIDKTKGEARKKLQEFNEIKKKILTQLEPIKKQVTSKGAIFKKAGNLVTDRQKAELKKWVDSYNMLKMKHDHVQKRIDKITEVIKSPDSYEGYVKVTGTMFPGTLLELFGMRKAIQHRFDRKTFCIGKNGEISAQG